MSFWEQIKGDLEDGIAEGIDIAKEGAAFVKEKAERLTDRTRRKLDLFEVKIQVRREMAELGGRIYELRHQGESPLLDSEVKTIIGRIEKLEDRIGGPEGNGGKG
ncbi:MAG TPA: hypothetical protein VK435_00720 [Thermodesulfovibrionales bacterium]|nr:hypothetical protein [Thermodesulfovibrionales bacterium]